MAKILRIINRFNLGGPTYNATFLTRFLSSDFETRLIGGSHEEHEGESLFIPEKYGVKPEIIDSLQREINFKTDRQAYKEIRRIIQEYKPDIVHTHASKAGALGRLAASKEKVPVVVHTFHGHVFHSYFGKAKTSVYKNAERWLAKRTDAIIAISDLQKKELVEEHKIADEDKIRVIPLGFDLNPFQEKKEVKRKSFRSEYGIADDEVVVALIGRLTPIKNHTLFFDAVHQLLKMGEQKVKAFIIGDGELMSELKKKAKDIETEMGKSIFVFTSWIKNIAEILPGIDLIALTSFNEGTPVSLIEAQAAGVPVISTDVGGVRDIVIDGKTGIVVSGFNPIDFASSLSILTSDKEKRQKMSQNGWIHVKDKYSYVRLCSDMEKLYVELLQKK